MKLSNEMVINAPLESAWALLTDLERIAPSMPGAVLEKIDGDEFTGTVSVKVGPIGVKYHGTARFRELDASGYRAVIAARGADSSGQGSVEALITARLAAEGTSTRVLVDTDLAISGRLAQFGRGALADVSARLMAQFVRNLDATLPGTGPAAGTVAAAGVAASQPAGGSDSGGAAPAAAAPADAASLDLIGVVGPVVARRLAPVLVGIVLGAIGTRWYLRRKL